MTKAPTHYIHAGGGGGAGGLLQGGAIAPQTKIWGARAPLHFGAQKHFYGCII